MKVRIKVTGAEEAAAALWRYSERKRQEIAEAVHDSAQAIQQQARERAPRATGSLKASIRVETAPDRLSATIGTDLEYGKYVEFGTHRHFPPPQVFGGGTKGFLIARSIARKGVKAQPFLLPAYREEKKRFLTKVKAILRKKG